jgi:hypothetical protein
VQFWHPTGPGPAGWTRLAVPRTVGYHLYKGLPKLGITARQDLARYPP